MIVITSAKLKMFANICANLVVAFLAAIPVTRDFDILTWNILGAMLSWYLGVKTEEVLEEL